MRNLLHRLLLATLAAGTLTATACYGHATYRTSGYGYIRTAPPPPREVYYRPRPGYVYVQGSWQWYGNDYRWRPGRYVRERPGYVYVQGKWLQRGDQWVWYDGRWEPRRSRVRVRDHRGYDDGRY
jgi:hypothetical protein